MEKKNIHTDIQTLENFKDYYKILELEPGASTAQIKKSWRRLIQLHHPDKQDSPTKNSTFFQEIQEAYETLTHPAKKQKYLQYRWLAKVTREEIVQKPTTVEELYLACIQVENKLASLRFTRIDEDYYMQYILFLLSAENIRTKEIADNNQTMDECIRLLLKAIETFSFKNQKGIIEQLEMMPTLHSMAEIQKFKKKKIIYWTIDRYQLLFVGVLTLILVGLIASIAN